MQRIFCALALVLVAGAAHATPPGVTDLEGTWFDAEEQPLFTYVLDTQPGQSACDADCLRVWTPLAAQPDAVASGDWSIVQQADGRTLCVHGNPNAVTRDLGTSSLAQGCAGQLATVQVERFDGPLPPIRAFEPPQPVARQ